jgi:MFS family permease
VLTRLPGAALTTDAPRPPAGHDRPVSRLPLVRRMVATYSVSAVGSAMVAVAVAYVAYQTSKSLVLTVVVLSASAVPTLVLLPVAGRISTGRDPRDIELMGQVAKILLSFAVAAVAASGHLTYVLLLAAQLLNGCVSAIAAPAWPRLARAISPEGRLAEVTALFGAVASAAAIAGALLGGFVCATFGFTWVFVANGLSYFPFLWAVRTVPRSAPTTHRSRRAIRTGIGSVRRSASLRRVFVLVTVLNLAAWPVLSVLPALAGDIDGRAHVLGILTGAFYAGAAVVAWVVTRLRRRFLYSHILFAGFLTAGLMLLSQAALTSWRSPGYDAVTVAVVTLVPIGLALSVTSTLLQTIVQLASSPDEEGPVLVVYGTVIAILTPLGGLLLGAAADLVSLWWAIALSGLALTTITIVLRRRLAVFNEVDDSNRVAPVHGASAHHLPFALLGSDHAHRTLAHLHDSAA